MELNFYQIDDVYTKSMAPLLLKILEEGKKAVIYCKDEARMQEIDKGLWQFSKTKFVPHVTNLEKDVEGLSSWGRQPIIISNEEENKNNADQLVLIDQPSSDFIKKFSRVFYFYDSQMLDAVKKFKQDNSKNSSKVKSYKKEAGKWIEFDL
jgi:DNA polymerase III subunit chi